jgi:hypothetical protein
MIVGVALLLVCTGSLIVVWANLASIEVSGGLAEGLDYIISGILTIRFQILLSLAILVAGVGVGILLYEIRNFRLIRQSGAAICVVIALASGFFAIQFLI